MAKEDNLKPWKEGQSGNPKGYPKGVPNRSTIAKKWLSVITKNNNPLTNALEELSQEDIITLAQLEKAKNGDSIAYKNLMDSAHGSPTQQIDQTLTDNTPKKIQYYNPDA